MRVTIVAAARCRYATHYRRERGFEGSALKTHVMRAYVPEINVLAPTADP